MPDRSIVFVGSLVPDRECASNPICNTAGNKFQKNFVGSLSVAAGALVETVSYVPARMFPRGRRIFYGPRNLQAENGQRIRTVLFVNLPIIKQLTQAISIFLILTAWHWRNRGRERLVIVYNVFAPHALPVLAARALFGGQAIALIADLPHGLYDFAGFWGLLQRLDFRVQTGSIRRFDGQITLTRMIAEDFAPNVPSMILEGGVDPDEAGQPAVPVAGDIRLVLFSGTLNEVNGTRLMLDAFALIADPKYRFRIFGRGPIEELVAAAAAVDSRIEYVGFQPNDEIVRNQRLATVLLNPRPTDHAITRYTFPSKLLEYMLSGRPVITTRLAGITADYYPYLMILDDESPEALAALIRRVCETAAAELEAFGREARDFVLHNKSWAHQAERVFEFVEELGGKRT